MCNRNTIYNKAQAIFPCNSLSHKRINWAAANGGVTNGGLRGVWPLCLEIGQNRPKSPFFCLFRPFPEGAKSTWKIQKTEEKGLFPQISSDLLKPPSLKPPFAALQINTCNVIFGKLTPDSFYMQLICNFREITSENKDVCMQRGSGREFFCGFPCLFPPKKEGWSVGSVSTCHSHCPEHKPCRAAVAGQEV